MSRVLALILAGGEHPALSVLTAERAEAAVPFAGKYRIIDFTLSNCINSGITNVGVLTQYRPRSLQEHIGVGKPWDLDRRIGGVHILHPYVGTGMSWQKGNADALRANVDFMSEQPEEHVLVLAGDHVYMMDYRPMIQEHLASQRDVTIAVQTVGSHEVQRFGIVTTDHNGIVTDFAEKPVQSVSTRASMGIYVFRKQFLIDVLNAGTHVNIGRDIMPALIQQTPVQTYDFAGYWADVGTVQAYYEASMALLSDNPALELNNPEWVIHTKSAEMPAAEMSAGAVIRNSMVCDGSRIGGTVSGSLIGPGVVIPAGTTVIDSIILPDVIIAPGCTITRAIIDKGTTIGSHCRIGHAAQAVANNAVPDLLHTGLTLVGMRNVVPSNTTLGANVLVAPRVDAATWARSDTYPDGSAVGLR